MPPTRIHRAVYEAAKMVSVGQDVSVQLTKPVKELVEWNFPLSQTLEKYCSSFNAKCNKNFGEAGLVLQNSTAVYVHRIDNLWNKIGYIKNILPNDENEDVPKNSSKRKDKKTDMCFQDFKTVDFAQEVEKNIDLKKDQITHDILKSKNRRFTQLEKNITQHIPIDICDVNGELIGKKYDFRCNQNVSMDGILIDEFAPQDFCCGDENCIIGNSISSNYSNQTKSLESSCNKVTDTVMQDIENNETASSDDESTGNDNWQTEENSFLASTLCEPNYVNQTTLCSTNTDTDNTIHATNTSNNCHEMTLTNISNETRTDTFCDANSPMITGINNTILSNNNTNAIYFNNHDGQSLGISSVLDSPPESVNSKERTLSTDDPMLNNTTEILLQAKLNADLAQSISAKRNVTEKTRVRSIPKTLSKSLSNRTPLKPRKRKRKKTDITDIFEELNSPRRDRSNMFKSSTACLKYIREYDSYKYEDITNEELDFLGFRLRMNEPEKNVDNSTNIDDQCNIDDNVMPTLSDDENSEMEFAQSSRSINMSPTQENLRDTSSRTDSPHFLVNVDKWHEYIQPKLREAEQRSAFTISDYTSQVMSTVKSKEKVNFDTIVQNEHPCEVARYFLASLDLASKYKIDINTNVDEHIELVLHKGSRQSSEADSHE